ncbi:hypothetical protein Taro_009409, partial [Colocasia esculenta]|nr:hypothetical protein [Colocasia esculenta]
LEVASQVVGRKDLSRSAFDVWREVALHLFSEREKEDLHQLVDSMVSYSITYKNLKPEPLSVPQKYGSSSDASMFSFDPRIDEFVKFKDYQSGHFVLSSATKQIVLHELPLLFRLDWRELEHGRASLSSSVCEVEKRKILIGSSGKLDINVESSSPNCDRTGFTNAVKRPVRVRELL